MRYIMKFNESSEYYTSIEPLEYNDAELSMIPFSESDKKRISDFLYGYEYGYYKGDYLEIDRNVGINSYTIFKNEDEWFFVISERNWDQAIKCDQIEGLIKYLQDEGITPKKKSFIKRCLSLI